METFPSPRAGPHHWVLVEPGALDANHRQSTA